MSTESAKNIDSIKIEKMSGASSEKINTESTEKVDTNLPKTTTVSVIPNVLPKMNPKKPLEHLGVRLDYKFKDNVKHGPLHKLRVPYDGKMYMHNTKDLPKSVDLSNFIPNIYNQKNLGACVAHSAAQAIRILVNKKDKERYTLSRLMWKDPYVEALNHPSRLYIYYNSRQIEGDSLSVDSGCTNHAACFAIEQYKICPEDVWPYEETNLNKHPSHKAYTLANKYTKFQYGKVERSIDQLKTALHNGHPVMVGVVVFPSLVASGSDGGDGTVPVPNPRTERPLGGHSILLVGYDNEKKCFKFINHWSNQWGANGYGTIGYDFLMNEDISGDFFAIENLS